MQAGREPEKHKTDGPTPENPEALKTSGLPGPQATYHFKDIITGNPTKEGFIGCR